MKIFAVIQLLAGLLCLDRLSAAVLSATNSGIYIAISGVSNNSASNEIVRFDDKLVWQPFSDIGVTELSYPDRQYGIKIRMVGPNGEDVKKTPLGNTFGTKFNGVRRFEDVTPARPIGAHSISMGSVEAQGRYDERSGGFSGRLLPAPNELFKMDRPGIYTIEIEMQMFKIIKGTNQWSQQLIKFPSVKMKIEKTQ